MLAAYALADPVRRDLLVALRDGPATAGRLAGLFPITRPAVSRHLRVLRRAELVTMNACGRERIYTLRTDPLDDLARWLEPFVADRRAVTPSPETVRWEARLDALADEVHRSRREHREQSLAGRPPATESASGSERN